MSTAVQPPSPPTAPLPTTPPPAGPGVVAWRVVGGIVAAVIVAFSVGGVVAGFTEQRRSRTTTYPGALSKVVVDTSTGSVELRAGAPGSSVSVEQNSSWSIGSSARTRDS